MVDLCLGLKGASNLYSVLGKSEKVQKTKTLSLGDCDKGQVEKERMTAAIQYTGSFRLPATGDFVKGTSERRENVKSVNYACKRLGDIKMFADVENTGEKKGDVEGKIPESIEDGVSSVTSLEERAKALGLPMLVSYKDLLEAVRPDEKMLSLLQDDLERKVVHDNKRLKEERDKVRLRGGDITFFFACLTFGPI